MDTRLLKLRKNLRRYFQTLKVKMILYKSS